ncbi:MAG: DUF4349 domain-containing protein [Oscillospiraceae bacterium]|jgi:hypothetical protein|nr:DUF4349 domain-containing protein [Oscillospiraceae bacterium]
MKKIFTALIISSCILGLAACSSSDNYRPADSGASVGAGGEELDFKSAPAASVYSGISNIERESADYTDESHNGGNTALPEEQTRMIIRDAWMTIEAENAVELYNNLSAFNRSLGGFEFSSSTQHHETFSSVDAVFKVPPERLDEFMSYAGESGRIVRSSTTSDDVTDRYYDMKTRVESKRRSLESYYSLLEKAESISEIVSLQRTIDNIIEEIEAFEGRLRVMENLVSMATVTLYISHENDPVLEERREIDWNALDLEDMGYFIRNGFISVVNFITTIFKWVIIAVIVISPLWVIPVIIAVIALSRRKKNKTKIIGRAQEITENTASSAEDASPAEDAPPAEDVPQKR